MGTDIYLHAERRCGHYWEYVREMEEFEDRNYEFFAILANVRNPIRSTEVFECLASQRGLPEDISAGLKNDPLLATGHNPGWVTARDFLDFDWEGKTISRSAVIGPAKLASLFGDGKQRFPRDRIASSYSLAQDGPGPRVTWVDSYKEAVDIPFWDALVKALATFGPPDDVRMVFSFDS